MVVMSPVAVVAVAVVVVAVALALSRGHSASCTRWAAKHPVTRARSAYNIEGEGVERGKGGVE